MSAFKLFNTTKFRKLLEIYASEKHAEILLVPCRYDGIYVEMNDITTLPFEISEEDLGVKVKEVFQQSEYAKNKMPEKKSDWPAFQHSKSKSMKAFEADYRNISVMGANEENISVEMRADLRRSDQLEIYRCISIYADDRKMGKTVIALIKKDIDD